MNDNYSHDDIEIMYVMENIPGPPDDSIDYELLLSHFNTLMLHNCQCNKMCVKMLCKCLQLSRGDNYERCIVDGELKHRLNHKPFVYQGYPMVECNNNCSCLPTCGNRVVQNGPMEGLVVKPCEGEPKGLGLFTSNFIIKGSFICEYAGELLTKNQAQLRSAENEVLGKMNYIFCLNEHTHEGIIQTIVDPSKFGNIGRYINHSCEPNCYIIPVRCESAVPHLAIFACVDIMPGSEITFSYGSGSNGDADTTTGKKRKKCLCKSGSCKGFLPNENF